MPPSVSEAAAVRLLGQFSTRRRLLYYQSGGFLLNPEHGGKMDSPRSMTQQIGVSRRTASSTVIEPRVLGLHGMSPRGKPYLYRTRLWPTLDSDDRKASKFSGRAVGIGKNPLSHSGGYYLTQA